MEDSTLLQKLVYLLSPVVVLLIAELAIKKPVLRKQNDYEINYALSLAIIFFAIYIGSKGELKDLNFIEVITLQTMSKVQVLIVGVGLWVFLSNTYSVLFRKNAI